MFCIETDKVTYNKIKTLLPDIRPELKITLLSCDDNLEKLGLCKSAPCVVSFDLNHAEWEHLLDDLMQIETDAFYTDDEEHMHDNNPYYQKYRKYGWLWGVLYKAEEKITAE